MGKVAPHNKSGQDRLLVALQLEDKLQAVHILVGVPLLNKIIQKLVTHPHKGTVAERIEILADLMGVKVPPNIKVIEKISFLIREYCFYTNCDEDDALFLEIKSIIEKG